MHYWTLSHHLKSQEPLPDNLKEEIALLKESKEKNWGSETAEEPTESLASTASLQLPSWVPDMYDWELLEDGSYLKTLKKKYNVTWYGKDGKALPRSLEELGAFLIEKGWTTRSTIWDFFSKQIYDYSYFDFLVGLAANSDFLPEYITYTMEHYQLSDGEWFFGNDDCLEDMVDFAEYMISWGYWTPRDESMEEKPEGEKPGGEKEKVKEEKGVPMDEKPVTPVDKNDENLKVLALLDKELFPDKKEEEQAEKKEDDKKEEEKPPSVLVRQRGKGPEMVRKTNTKADPWELKWRPLTKTGYLDFIEYCSGHVPSHTTMGVDQSLHGSLTYGDRNLQEPKKESAITWQQIKPGEATYLLETFFCQVPVGPKDMSLQQLIDYTKSIDFESMDGIPADTPLHVQSTIYAIGNMWATYGTDQACEVRMWLNKQCLVANLKIHTQL